MVTDKRVLYPNKENGIAVLIPSPHFKGTIQELAIKDVPKGVPFLIVKKEEIPQDRINRNLWTADFSQPDGHGG